MKDVPSNFLPAIWLAFISYLRKWVLHVLYSLCHHFFLYLLLMYTSGAPDSLILELNGPVLGSLRPLPFLMFSVHVHDFVDLAVASSHPHCSRLKRVHCPFPWAASPSSLSLHCGLSSAPGMGEEKGSGLQGRGRSAKLAAKPRGRLWALHPALRPQLAGPAQVQLLKMTPWCLKPDSSQATHSSVEILQCDSHCFSCWLRVQ